MDISLKDIWIDRGSRQRKEIIIEDLLESIPRNGVLVPIIVIAESGPANQPYKLIAGERRYTASRQLHIETIPARLQQQLTKRGRRVVVFNFGRGFYTLNQERVLFEKLLVNGVKPTAAVFVDGINEAFFLTDHTELSPLLDRVVRQINENEQWREGLNLLPVWRLLPGSESPHELATLQTDAVKRQLGISQYPTIEQFARIARDRYLANRLLADSAAREFGVKSLFVWQPAPTYGFDKHDYPFGEDPSHKMTPALYLQLSLWQSANNPGSNFLDLSGAHQGHKAPLYVDSIHYSAAFCAVIAELIATQIETFGWLN